MKMIWIDISEQEKTALQAFLVIAFTFLAGMLTGAMIV
jgi:hypothetical protein